MPEPTTSNRRWRSAAKWLAVIVVVLIAGAVAWSQRPLNRTERRLVGGWTQVRSKGPYDNLDEDILWFRGNRRFEVTRPQERRLPTGAHVTTQVLVQEGAWGASSTLLFKTFDMTGVSRWKMYWQKPLLFYYRLLGRNRSNYPIQFDGPDRVWVNEVEFERVRSEPAGTPAVR